MFLQILRKKTVANHFLRDACLISRGEEEMNQILISQSIESSNIIDG